MKKAPLLNWWSSAKGNGDDLTYYKKSRKIVRFIQAIYIVFGILMIAVKMIAFSGILVIVVKAIGFFVG